MKINYKKLTTIIIFLLTNCKAGPDYVKPKTETAEKFKEWQIAVPQDDVIRDKWWEAFNDSELNKLEEQVNISNQTIKAAEAAYRQASALTDEATAAYFPTVSVSGGVTRSGTTAVTSTGGSSKMRNNYTSSLGASWVPDLWGRVARTVEADTASKQASAADLALAKLSAQSQLAIDYLNLRISDEQKRLLDSTVEAYTKSLTITQNQYNLGVAAKSDVLQARTQLESTQAQATDVGIARAQLEHAIAILVGKVPANFAIKPVKSVPNAPNTPTGIPSALLERRPDIAASERLVVAANAQIGLAKTAYYPNLTLSASGGYQSSSFAEWFNLPNRVWSIGPSLAETLFDGGLRKAQTKAAIAAYDQAVANYRQTVLTSFQEVEDNLVALRVLKDEAEVEQKAVNDADKVLNIFLNQYKAGTISYLNVVSAQTTALNTKLAALAIKKSQLNAGVSLIENLGGGWNVNNPLPKIADK